MCIFKNKKIKELTEKLSKLEHKYNELSSEYDSDWDIFSEYINNTGSLESEKKEVENKCLKLEEEINFLNEIIEELKLEKLNLEEELKIRSPDWNIQADCAWRINPVTGKREEHEIPFDFDGKRVRKLKSANNGSTQSFKYYDKSDPDNNGKWKFYEDIPTSLFDSLYYKNSKFKYQNYKSIFEGDIKDINDLKNLLNKKGKVVKGKYAENVYRFIFKKIGKRFSTKEFISNCKFRNRESARQYLLKLIEFEIIRRFVKGDYKVILMK